MMTDRALGDRCTRFSPALASLHRRSPGRVSPPKPRAPTRKTSRRVRPSQCWTPRGEEKVIMAATPVSATQGSVHRPTSGHFEPVVDRAVFTVLNICVTGRIPAFRAEGYEVSDEIALHDCY